MSCKSSKVVTDSDLELLSKKFLGENIIIKRNSTNTFAIVYSSQKRNIEHPVNGISYGIVNLATKEMIFQESLNDGKVEWEDDENVLVKSKSGIIQKINEQNSMNNYIINVYTLEKKFK
nr:hypothetical protein [uncultured Carboxylicivirga sp.]